jgi:hypothetical protein
LAIQYISAIVDARECQVQIGLTRALASPT